MEAADLFAVGVYRLFDYDGSLIYIGSGEPRVRIRAHVTKKPWGAEIDLNRTVIEWHPTKADAFAAELAAIKSECPRYNIAGTPAGQTQCKQVARAAQVRAVVSGKRIGQPFASRHVAGIHEIALRLGCGRQRAHQIVREQNWPAPFDVVAAGTVWRQEDIERWIAKHRPELILS